MVAVDERRWPFQVNDLKDFLEGLWSLERRIDDCRAGQAGRLCGKAVFTAEGAELVYREEGRLRFGDHEGPALQSYRYGFPTPARAAVHFSDGRSFHELDLSRGVWTCTHLCDPDRYEGRFLVPDADTLRVVWKVMGPRKEQRLDSTYRRAL